MAHYELTICGEFAASHRLRMYDGQVEPLHGHNWRVEMVVTAPRLDSIGVGADFGLLQRTLDEALNPLRDRHLNDLAPFSSVNPSAENVARHVFEEVARRLPPEVRAARVRVWETSRCAATYCVESFAQPTPRT